MSLFDRYPLAKARLIVLAGFFLLLFVFTLCGGVYYGARRLGQELGLIRKPPPAGNDLPNCKSESPSFSSYLPEPKRVILTLHNQG